MKRLLLFLFSFILAGCGNSSDFPSSGEQAGPTTNLNRPLVLMVDSGRIGPIAEILEITLVPRGDTVLVGEDGEAGEIFTAELLERADLLKGRSAKLEYQLGERTRILYLKILELQEEADGSLTLRARATEVSASQATPGQGLKAQGITTGAFSAYVTAQQDGSALPGAIVEAVHEPTGTNYRAVTMENGRARIFNARSGGPYVVSASLPGFRTLRYSNVFLKLGETLELDFPLVSASLEETFDEGRLRVSPTP